MTIVKRTAVRPIGPAQELVDLRRRMLNLFQEPFSLPLFGEQVGWVPDVDITEQR